MSVETGSSAELIGLEWPPAGLHDGLGQQSRRVLAGPRVAEVPRTSAALKRAFDLLAVSVGLLAVLPLMLAVAVAIKLDGGGSVIFRQWRVGRHGRRFQMLKFRTMVPEADALKELAAPPQRSTGRPLQDRRGPPCDPCGQVSASQRAG